MLEHKLTAGECAFALNDQAALLQLLSQAEKVDCVTDDYVSELNRDRQSLLKKRLKAGPLTSSHLAVLQLLGQAEVAHFLVLNLYMIVHQPKKLIFCCRVLN